MVKRKKYAEAKRAKKAAQPVVLPHDEARPTVAIIGGGASGIAAACAIAACAHAQRSDVRVLILEQGRRIGSSILRSGNGRCNFSHEAMLPDAFNQPVFVEQVFQVLEKAFSSSPLNLSEPIAHTSYENAVLQWFASLGLVWREAPLSGGALYPFSNKASSVLEVLQAELDRCGVECYCGVAVKSIEQQGDRFSLELERIERAANETHKEKTDDTAFITADKVVYAAGGQAVASFTDDSSISDLLARIKRISCKPVLGPLETSTEYLAGLDGIRTRVRLNCAAKGFSEEGELLFRKYGVSGIVVFNASRFVEPGDVITLDFVPERSLERLRELLCARAAFLPDRAGNTPTAADLLRGFLLPEIAHALIQFAAVQRKAGAFAGVPADNSNEGSLGDTPLDEAGIVALASAIKCFELEVKGIGDPKQCQVQRGGFRVDAVDTCTMETRDVPGLYMCGEALDVDGPCGGYNLHWAWSSGLLVGLLIASEFLERDLV